MKGDSRSLDYSSCNVCVHAVHASKLEFDCAETRCCRDACAHAPHLEARHGSDRAVCALIDFMCDAVAHRAFPPSDRGSATASYG